MVLPEIELISSGAFLLWQEGVRYNQGSIKFITSSIYRFLLIFVLFFNDPSRESGDSSVMKGGLQRGAGSSQLLAKI